MNQNMAKENEVCTTPSTLQRCCDVCTADVGLQLQASNDCMAYHGRLALTSVASACLTKFSCTNVSVVGV